MGAVIAGTGKGSLRTALAAVSLVLLPVATGAAELKGYAENCPEEKRICFWHKAVVKPPKGWVEDQDWSRRYKALVLFDHGDQRASKPIMYVRAHAGDRELGLDDYVRVAQARWQDRLTDSTIEELAGLERKGKPAFKVYLYKNPSTPDQAFELTAFTKDVDDKHPGETYFFQAVLASPTIEELDKAKPAFMDLLSRL